MEYLVYDIVLHVFNEQEVLLNVHARKYTYDKLLNDVCNCRYMPKVGGLIKISAECENGRMIEVANDDNVHEMFEKNRRVKEVHVWVEIDVEPPLNTVLEVTELSDDDKDNEGTNIEERNDFGEESDGLRHVADMESGDEIEQINITDVEDVLEGDDIDDEDEGDENTNDVTYHGHEDVENDANEVNITESSAMYENDGCNVKIDDYQSGDDAKSSDSEAGYWDEVQNDKWVNPMSKYMNVDEYEVPQQVGEKVVLQNGQIFETVDKFRMVLKEYVIQEGIEMKRVKNEKKRVTCKCAAEGCPWRVHASPLPDGVTFSIKTLISQHTCTRVSHIKEADSAWMAGKLIDVLRENPDMKPAGIRNELQKYGLNPAYMQLYRAKRKALEVIEGSHAISYKELARYAEMIKRTNVRSIVKLQYNFGNDEHCQEQAEVRIERITATPTFKRIFVGLEALRTGFLNGCSPFLGFDGCHLKGPYGGILLSVNSLDGDNGLFPVAWAVVESECKDSWMFFFECLEQFLGGFGADKPWTFISDRQKGLVECIDQFVPHARNRRCARHIFANFIRLFPYKKLRSPFWRASRSYNAAGYKEGIEKIRSLNEAAYAWLMEIGPSLWTRHGYPKELKNGHVTNNFAESFNNWINELRFKPILSLLEGLRAKVMMRINNRATMAKKWSNNVMPNILKKANSQKEWSRHCNIMAASASLYEVRERDTHFTVDMEAQSCDCGISDLSGIPCRHACVVISHCRESIEKFIDKSFSRVSFLNAYGNIIRPVPDLKFWPDMPNILPATLLPPPLKRLPGRPKKNRRREQGEGPSSTPHRRLNTLKCSVCKRFGHNRRGCQRVGSSSRGRGQRRRRQRRNVQEQTATRDEGSVNVDLEPNVPLANVVEIIRPSKRRRTNQPAARESVRGSQTREDVYVPAPPTLAENGRNVTAPRIDLNVDEAFISGFDDAFP